MGNKPIAACAKNNTLQPNMSNLALRFDNEVATLPTGPRTMPKVLTSSPSQHHRASDIKRECQPLATACPKRVAADVRRRMRTLPFAKIRLLTSAATSPGRSLGRALAVLVGVVGAVCM